MDWSEPSLSCGVKDPKTLDSEKGDLVLRYIIYFFYISSFYFILTLCLLGITNILLFFL